MTPRRGNTILFRSSQQLPRLRLEPLKGPRLALLTELQRDGDTVRCATLGTEVPGQRQKQLTQTSMVCFYKTHFFSVNGVY